ncbi:Peptidase inhibitor I9 [Caloramator quimbayensis]|uniref:Peptidase inhibitor I9 n=1 Tax=Caloramator quimbayensis TaxID=1147123 RepID=A0A1T4XH71_9CLOT|nr:S8 family serine peptidase [Caloramator quimbayensis]SKA88767.1 Peptidase inhibitor I9 [Caloramator quimbayensis]
MKKESKIFSIFISLVMVFSIFTSLPVKAKAETKALQIDKKALIQKHMKNLKDVDYKKALSQKYGVEASDEKTSSENKVINPEDEVRIIVELEGTTVYEQSKSKKLSLTEKKTIEQNIEKAQKAVMDKVKYYGKIRHSYKNLLNGFSATVKYKDIDAIRELTNVKKVTVANKYYLDMNSARGITNTETVWQDLGYKGEGMVVAIVDTGIDYTHKDMRLTDSSKAKLNKTTVESMGGPGKFYTDKVPYGYNFADMNDQVMDLGPNASMHGMHVAGIVAANGTDEEVANNAAIKGVAPEAQLLAMKVFTNNPDMPSAYSDDIAAAIDDSVKHGADVINMSLGSTAGFVNYDDPEQIAIKNATDMGVTVVVSAGNSYYSTYPYSAYAMDPDISLVGSPGLFPDTLQVASSENSKITLNTLKVYIDEAQEPVNIAYQKQESPDPVKVFKDNKLEAVYVGTGEPQYYEGKNVEGKLVFAVRTGGYYYKNIQKTAEQHGAAGVIIRGTVGHGDYVNMALDNPQIPIVSLSINDGNNLMNAALEGKKLEFTFTNDKMLVNNATANQMSDFSSWGTTPDLEFKPEVSAPGGKIYSTVNNNDYTMMSGTSMAAPHTSGATALVAQYVKTKMPTLKGRDFVNMVKTLLINSAEPMLDPSTGGTLPYLTRKQGAGVIKTDKAIKTGAYVTTDDGKAVIALKEISGTKEFKLNITNFSDKDITFKPINKYGVLTNYSTSSGFMYARAEVLNGASLTFDNEEITVAAGETAEITATLIVPTTAYNIFAEGFIELQSQTEGQPSLGIPYMGFCGKWSGQDAPRMIDAPVWDLDNTFYGMTCLTDSNGYYLGYDGFDDYYGIPIINPNQLAFSPNGDEMFDDVMPVVSFMRNAKEFKIQVIDENGKVIREISYDKNIRKNYLMQDFPAKSYIEWRWDGTIFDSSKLFYQLAPEGNYKIRLLSKPDFKDADWYTLDMPVRLDLTPPDFDFDIEKVQGNEFKVKIKNPSNDIQFYGYYLIDKWGNFLWDDLLNVDSNGEATVNLINADCYFGIYAVDYAANATDKGKYIINTSFEVFSPEDCIFIEGYPGIETKDSATINFRINEALRPVLDHIGIKVVNAGNVRDEVTLTTSETSYKIESLVDGECDATVTLYGKNKEIMGTGTKGFLVDLTPPQITLLNTTGSSINLTDGEKEYNLKFKVSDMSTGFKVLLNGQTVAEEHKDLGKLYEKTFEIPVQINEGENKFTIEAEDLVGHKAVSEVIINSILDKPVIAAYYPQYIGNKKVIVSGNVIYKSGVAITEFKINDEEVQLNGNNFVKELTFDSFGDKTITYYVKAEDNAENTFNQNFKLSPIIFENRIYKTKENSQTINFNIVQDETLSEAKLFVNFNGNETEYATTSSSITVENLNDGNNIVEFIIRDKDNNEIVRDYVEVFVDKALPYITAIDDNGNNISEGQIYSSGKVHITGQVSEPVKYLKYKVYGKDGESEWADIPVSEGFFETTLNLFEGMNRVTFEMEDETGNINSYQAKIWVDTTAPVLTIEPDAYIIETDKDEYTIKINVKENTYSYRLYVNENQIDYGESESVEGIEKTIEYNYSVPEGESNVLIKAVDVAGNTSVSLIKFYKNYNKVILYNDYAEFEKRNGDDVIYNVKFNGDKLNGVKFNNTELQKDKDYTVGENAITFKKDFLMTLPVGENVLTLTFDSGDYNVVVKVTDSRSTNAALSSITVGGNVLSGFAPDKYEYEYEVNPMLTEPLKVSANAMDSEKAKVEITQATEVEGTAVIKVTAQDGTVKVYTIKFIIPLKLELLSNVTEFAKNIDAVIKVKAANISKALKNAQLIIGLFDKDNKLVNYVAGGYQIKSGEEVVMEGQIKTPNADGYKIKCFVWDILNNQNPLSKVFEFLIK